MDPQSTPKARGQGTKIIKTTKDLEAASTPGLWRVDGVTGLYLQVTKATQRSWLLRYTMDGKAREKGLGSAAVVGLTEAKRKATALRTAIHAGTDPLAKVAVRRVRTFREAAEAYIEAQSAGWTSEVHAEQWTTTLATYAYPTLGDRRCDEIAVDDVLAILRPIWNEKTETANRVRGRIEAVIGAEYARSGWDGYRNPAVWKGLLQHLLAKPGKVAPVEHHRALAWRDAPEVYKRIAALRTAGALALRFALLTASRTRMVRGATWAEIDMGERVWRLSPMRAKGGNGSEETTSGTKGATVNIPLSDEAMAVLDAARALPRWKEDEHIFPGQKAGAGMSDMTLLQVHYRLGIDATVHGWRSTFRDWAGEATDHHPDIAEAALGHALGSKVRLAYQRGDLLEKRRVMMADWAAYLTADAAT
jgi:integrase